MKRRAPLILGAIVVLSAVAIMFEPTGVVRGRLMGEAFFEGRPTGYWRSQLSGGPAEQAAALESLKKPQAVPVLRELLANTSSSAHQDIRWRSAELLKELGPEANSAAVELLTAAREKDDRLPSVAAAALPKVGTSADLAVPVLTSLLRSPHAVIAARALSEYKAQAKSALPELIRLMKDRSQPVEARWNAARTIGKVGPDALSALPALIEMTRDPEPNVREHSAEAIGDIGPTATAGIPALVAAMKDDFVKARRDAVRSLGWIGPAAKEAGPEMVKLLDDPEQIVRDAARKALETVAPELLPAAEPKTDEPAPTADTPAATEPPAS